MSKETETIKFYKNGYPFILDAEGEFKIIDVDKLLIPNIYQRHLKNNNAKKISESWSWSRCGALTVAQRGKEFYVIDGQHRLAAAKGRLEVRSLPCMVFKTTGDQFEANIFLDVNIKRKTISPIDKYKAQLVAGDQDSLWLDEKLKELGLKLVNSANKLGEIGSVSKCLHYIKMDKVAFLTSLRLLSKIAINDNIPINPQVLGGLFFIDRNTANGLHDKKVIEKIFKIGANNLANNAIEKITHGGRGTESQWAIGMINADRHSINTSTNIRCELLSCAINRSEPFGIAPVNR